MDEFLTDEEQAEKAKSWLRENGVFLLSGVVLGLGGLFGWQSWESSRMQTSGEASVVWQQLQDAIAMERFNEATETLALLESDYASTPYLDQARLTTAKMHMDRNAPEDAIDVLQSLVSNTSDEALRRVAEIRIAQVYLYLERYDDALAVLGDEDSTGFAAQFHELRGDIFLARAELEDARDEYQLALATDTAGIIDRGYVQMKLDDVAGSVAALPQTLPAEDAAATEDSAADVSTEAAE